MESDIFLDGDWNSIVIRHPNSDSDYIIIVEEIAG